MSNDTDPPRVEFRVREHTPAGVYDRQQAVYERLQQLQEAGMISDVSVEVWEKQVSTGSDTDPDETDHGVRSVRNTYQAFEDWATRNGHALTPAFDTRECGTLVSTDRREVIVFPVMCLAVYDGEEIGAVFPCSTGDDIRTVEDGLAAIESGDWGDVVTVASE